ncbi:hypothetical protein GCM10027084_24170 [Pseudoxanthomonas sangjuensis]|uniref:DUF2242 domain-containing protein n=1 Tax=Pseudoxanthomonas sangjuensis TaxID=1503750 RepID=UPI001FEA6770|nr:DUF2242 domain-containing protein [Pseudoxanthomonas sangjuensis]
MPRFLPCVAACALLALSSCATTALSKKGSMLAKESFDSDGAYSRSYAQTPAQVCQSAYRALLSQGYVAKQVAVDAVEAVKNFQPEAEVHEQMTMRVSCVQQASGRSWVFASAQQDRYNLRKSNNSASLGVSALGSLSLPIGSTDDSLVKVGSMTVQDAGFYRAFFKVVERFLPPPPPAPEPTPEATTGPVPEPMAQAAPEPRFDDAAENGAPAMP